jgi:hypothetical protein
VGGFVGAMGCTKIYGRTERRKNASLYVLMLVTPLLKFNTTFINNNFMVSPVE